MDEHEIKLVLSQEQDGEARVLAEHHGRLINDAPGRSFFNEVAQLREAMKCTVCHKSTVILNLNAFGGHRRPLASESVKPETHCTCKGGPAEGLVEREIRAHIVSYFETTAPALRVDIYRDYTNGDAGEIVAETFDPHRASSEPNDVTRYRYECRERHVDGADVEAVTMVELDWQDGTKGGAR